MQKSQIKPKRVKRRPRTQQQSSANRPNVNPSTQHLPYLQQEIAKFESIGALWNGRRPYQNQPVKLRYVASHNISASSISLNCDRISMNSLYDPEITYAGHQPDFYDFWCNLYGSYYVVECTIEFKLVNTSTAPTSVVLVPVQGTSTVFSTLQDAQEAPFSKFQMLGALGAQSTKTIRSKSNLVQQLSQRNSVGTGIATLDSMVYYRIPTNSAPTWECSWQLYLFPTDATSTVTTTYTVTIEYTAVMTDIVDSNPSLKKQHQQQLLLQSQDSDYSQFEQKLQQISPLQRDQRNEEQIPFGVCRPKRIC